MKKLISKKTICERTSLSRATIDRYANDPAYAHVGFPRGVKVGGFRKVWDEAEVNAWIEAQLSRKPQ